jgi:DNA repair protein RadC
LITQLVKSIGKIDFTFHHIREIVNELLKKNYKLYDQVIKLTFIPQQKQTK